MSCPRVVSALLLTVAILGGDAGAEAEEPTPAATVPAPYDKLLPLHKTLAKPQPGDWLASHPEPGQTYRQYLRSRPVTPDKKRRVIYVQPLGNFTATQRRIITLSAEYMGLYFNLPVKIKEDLPLSVIPQKARRTHPDWGMEQILQCFR